MSLCVYVLTHTVLVPKGKLQSQSNHDPTYNYDSITVTHSTIASVTVSHSSTSNHISISRVRSFSMFLPLSIALVCSQDAVGVGLCWLQSVGVNSDRVIVLVWPGECECWTC